MICGMLACWRKQLNMSNLEKKHRELLLLRATRYELDA